MDWAVVVAVGVLAGFFIGELRDHDRTRLQRDALADKVLGVSIASWAALPTRTPVPAALRRRWGVYGTVQNHTHLIDRAWTRSGASRKADRVRLPLLLADVVVDVRPIT